MPRAIWVALGLLVILLAVACGDSAVATVTPVVETATPAPDTPSPTGTAEPLPTDSPLPVPTATATARLATATVRPATATATPRPFTPAASLVTPAASLVTATATPSPGPSATPSGPSVTPAAAVAPTVSVGGATFSVELAVTSDEQRHGLSDRPSMDPGAGMLFVYDSPKVVVFWMKNMHFPLDILWIGADCTLVDFSRNVPPPAPGTESSDLERYRPGADIQYVLEVNAGAAAGMQVGNPVEFGGAIAGEYDC